MFNKFQFWLYKLTNSMGSMMPTLSDLMPQMYSYQQYEKTVVELNAVSKHLAPDLQFILVIHVGTLSFNFSNWKSSTAKATIGIGLTEVKQMAEEGEAREKEYRWEREFQLGLQMRQIYKVHDLLKYFKKEESQKEKEKKQQTPKSCSEGVTPTETPTAKGDPGDPHEKGNRQCQICFDEEADLALPCGHRFGANCISAYIIQKEEKLCPMCRRQFLGSRSSIERKLFTIIENNDTFVYQQIKEALLSILRQSNEKVITEVELSLREKSGSK